MSDIRVRRTDHTVAIQAALRQRVPGIGYESYLADLRFIEVGPNQLQVEVPKFAHEWVRRRYRPAIQQCAEDQFGPGVVLRFSVPEAQAESPLLWADVRNMSPDELAKELDRRQVKVVDHPGLAMDLAGKLGS